MKPQKILRQATRMALAAFGQVVLQEGVVWAARRMERGTGRRKKRRDDPALGALVVAGGRYLEERWDDLFGKGSGRGRSLGADDGSDGDREGGERRSRRGRRRRRS
jgi:hypothetical protein